MGPYPIDDNLNVADDPQSAAALNSLLRSYAAANPNGGNDVDADMMAAGSSNPPTGRPNFFERHPAVTQTVQGLADVLRQYGEMKTDPRVRLEERGQNLGAMEALARIRELQSWHDQSIAARNQATDVRSQHYEDMDALGQAKLKAQRQQMTAAITNAAAKMGLAPQYDENGTFVGLRKMEASELGLPQQSTIDLNSARAGEATSRGSYYDQLPGMREHLQKMRDDTLLEIQRMRSGDRDLDRALRSDQTQYQAAHQLYVTQMAGLIRERANQERLGWVDYGSKENFDRFYNQAATDAANQLKSSVHGAPSGNSGARIRVRNRATGQTGTLLQRDFDSSRYEQIK